MACKRRNRGKKGEGLLRTSSFVGFKSPSSTRDLVTPTVVNDKIEEEEKGEEAEEEEQRKRE